MTRRGTGCGRDYCLVTISLISVRGKISNNSSATGADVEWLGFQGNHHGSIDIGNDNTLSPPRAATPIGLR